MPYIDFSFWNIDNKLHAMIKNGLFAILEKRFCEKNNCKFGQRIVENSWITVNFVETCTVMRNY